MVGEALIRPSAKKHDCLAVHWLVRPGIMKVIEVGEEDKDTDASIGNILKIKNEVFSGIDELLSRYIMSMNDRVEQIVHHRKFVDKMEDEVDEDLKAAKKKSPAGIYYQLCWNEDYPGYISLRYIINSARSHHIGLSPDGFVWGRQSYPSIDRLLNDFKKNPRGPPGSSAAKVRGLQLINPRLRHHHPNHPKEHHDGEVETPQLLHPAKVLLGHLLQMARLQYQSVLGERLMLTMGLVGGKTNLLLLRDHLLHLCLHLPIKDFNHLCHLDLLLRLILDGALHHLLKDLHHLQCHLHPMVILHLHHKVHRCLDILHGRI